MHQTLINPALYDIIKSETESNLKQWRELKLVGKIEETEDTLP